MSPDSLTDLARTAAGSAPDLGALTAAVAAGSVALAGLASGVALAEVGRLWAQQAESVALRWRLLSRTVEQAGVDYGDVDAELAS